MGYVMGKAEGEGELWHGHVTAITVSPKYRRMGLAKKLMGLLEEVSEKVYNGYFVDLFVRKSNAVAIEMYTKFGYSVYRTVLEYYTGPDGEDAYGTDCFIQICAKHFLAMLTRRALFH
jgi:N-terminal acetyltransferase B complex catalytic subunit